MRLIHCADLHLDSPMESHLPPDKARERRAELLHTFARLVDWAKENHAGGILIAGDLFDTGRVTAKTIDFVIDRIAASPEITFYYLRGNHDEDHLFRGRTLPENLVTFGRGWTYYRRGNVVIAGAEPEDWDSFYDGLELPADTVNIVLLHGQDSARSGEDLIALPRLRGKYIDYLALGHIHSFRRDRLDDRGMWCCCGCPAGRGFDECGEKGFVVLDIGDGQVDSRFVPFAARRLYEVRVDITRLQTVTEIQNAMEAGAAEIDPGSLVKFTLTGFYTPQTQKDPEYLRKALESRFWFVRIKDESRLRLDPGTYEHDASLKGEFIRLVMASDKSEEDKARIICAGLRALMGEEVSL